MSNLEPTCLMINIVMFFFFCKTMRCGAYVIFTCNVLQARSIQEVAKKDFENLRQDSDASEPEPEPLPEPEPKPQRRRGRPPKNAVKQQLEQPPAERATTNFSAATLAAAGNSGLYAHSGFDIQRRIADVLKASFANRNNEHNWSSERKLESIEDYSGFFYHFENSAFLEGCC